MILICVTTVFSFKNNDLPYLGRKSVSFRLESDIYGAKEKLMNMYNLGQISILKRGATYQKQQHENSSTFCCHFWFIVFSLAKFSEGFNIIFALFICYKAICLFECIVKRVFFFRKTSEAKAFSCAHPFLAWMYTFILFSFEVEVPVYGKCGLAISLVNQSKGFLNLCIICA